MPMYGQGWTPDQEGPDDVQPGDLQQPKFPGQDMIALQARRYGGGPAIDADNADLSPEQKARVAANETAMGLDQPPGQSSAPDRARAEAELAPDLPAAPPQQATPAAPKSKQGGGAGGGAPAAKQQLGISTGEQQALDRQESADTEAMNIASRKTGQEEQKAQADLELAQREQAAHQEFDQRAEKVRADAHAYLKQQQDAANKYEITDFFADRPAAMRTQAALWTGLGAFASSFTHGPNQALEIINGAIERDHRLKLEHAQKLTRGVDDARAGMKDAEIELAAQEAGMLRKLADQRAVRMKKFGMDDAAIAGDELRNKLLQESANRQVIAQRGIEDRIMEQKKFYVQEAVARSEVAKNYAEAGRIKAEANAKQGPNLDVTGPGGRVLFRARNEKEATEANDKIASVRDVLAKAKELRGLLAEGPTFFGQGERARKMDEIQSDLVTAVNHVKKLGALDKGALEILEKQIPNRAGMGGGGVDTIDQFIAGTRAEAARSFDSYGVPGARLVQAIESGEGGATPGSAPAPSRTEYAMVMNRIRSTPPGPERDRMIQAAQAMRAAAGR